MFDWLIHSSIRVKMMKMFFKEPGKALYGLEIAQHLKTSPGTIHRELNALTKQEVLHKKREGALIMYRLNTAHPYFAELRKALFPQKGKTRILLLSDLRLTQKSSAELLHDFSLVLQYAQENSTDLVFLGNSVDLHAGDGFATFLSHKHLVDRVNSLAHELSITVVPGDRDKALDVFCHGGQGSRLFDSKIVFHKHFIHEKLGIFGDSSSSHGMASEVFRQGYAYAVFAGESSFVKETKDGILLSPGSFSQSKKRHFVEIDEEGAAVIDVEQLKA